MNSQKTIQHAWLAKFLPSLTDVAFLMPLVFLMLASNGLSGLLTDGDTGWHIRTGQWILAHGQVPHKDLFSYTMPDKEWFAWEWLWDVIFGWLHLHTGLTGVVLLSLLFLCLTSALVFRLALRRSANPLVAIAVTYAFCNGSSIHWHARPHLVTLLLAAIFCHLFDRIQQGRQNLLWLLPALMLLWTNLHGGFFVGLILIGAYAAGAAITSVLDADPARRRAALLSLRNYALTGLACFAVTFVNPYGYQLHRHVLEYLTNSKMLESIGEFQSLSFHHPAAIYFEAVLLLAVVAAFQATRRREFGQALVLVGWGHLALVAGRNIPILLIVAAGPVAAVAAQLLSLKADASLAPWFVRAVAGFRARCQEFAAIDGLPRLHLASAAIAALTVLVAFAPRPPHRFQARFQNKNFPVKALAALHSGSAGRKLFTLDQWGDYVIYQNPESKVFFDGRSDFYGEKFTSAYGELLNVKYDWADSLRHYQVDTVLLPTSTPLVGVLKESAQWRVTYDDGKAITFQLRSASLPQGPKLELEPTSFITARGGEKSRDPWITSQVAR